LAVAFAGIAYSAARGGSGSAAHWVVAIAAAALSLWLASLAFKALR
jgi:hypothetical protein